MDVVVAADGLKSRSNIPIAGQHSLSKASNMSNYRIAYSRKLAMRDETARKRWVGLALDVRVLAWPRHVLYTGVFLPPDIVS